MVTMIKNHLIIASVIFCATCAISFADDALFTVSPQQMVFASKLSDSSRKIFSHKFSLKDRQKALELWNLMQEEDEYCSADDAVASVMRSIETEEVISFSE